MAVETISNTASTVADDEKRLAKLYGGAGGCGDEDAKGVEAKAIVDELGRHLNCLESDNRATRKRAIEGITKDTMKLEPDVLQIVFRSV